MNVKDFFKFNDQPNPRIISELMRLSNDALLYAKEPGMAMFLQMTAQMYQNGNLRSIMDSSMDKALAENPALRKMFEAAAELAEQENQRHQTPPDNPNGDIFDEEIIIH
jgi:hypothetical protein